MRLIYIGRLLKGAGMEGRENPRLWNLILPGHPYHGSTIGLQSLRDLGFIR